MIGAHAARWVSGEVVPSEEVREARWVSLEEAGGLPTTAGLLPILAAALDGRRPARAGPTLSARRPIGR